MGSTCSGNSLQQVIADSPEAAAVYERLVALCDEKSYLNRKVHPFHRWVEKCQAALEINHVSEAQDHLFRLETALQVDDKRLRAAFDTFDMDKSGELEVKEFQHFVTYVGFGPDAVLDVLKATDKDSDGKISIEEFEAFVGQVGGVMALFQKQRVQRASSGDGEKSQVLVGSRVRAYYKNGEKRSKVVWDARAISLNEEQFTAELEFGFGEKKFLQLIPKDWIQEDVDLVEALREIGIVDSSQHYWSILLPPDEQHVVKSLAQCQKSALFEVRRQASANHLQALDALQRRFVNIGQGSGELWSVLTWVRDVAPVIIHIDLDSLGRFFESDSHYRNQFETNTSSGLLSTSTRSDWERDLFAGRYDDAKSFERPKYGVLDVMNDHKGVVCARQYGDSYLTLKNVRLRCTFAPEDSGGICSNRLAVLDQYAHVLLEFSDEELREVSRVANAEEGSEDRIGDSQKLEDYNYKEAQIHGEIDLSRHVERLVVHPRHRVDGWNETRCRALCQKHGWEFTWMDDERTRRIHEERQAKDSSVLEMSWHSEDRIAMPKLEANSGKWALG